MRQVHGFFQNRNFIKIIIILSCMGAAMPWLWPLLMNIILNALKALSLNNSETKSELDFSRLSKFHHNTNLLYTQDDQSTEAKYNQFYAPCDYLGEGKNFIIGNNDACKEITYDEATKVIRTDGDNPITIHITNSNDQFGVSRIYGVKFDECHSLIKDTVDDFFPISTHRELEDNHYADIISVNDYFYVAWSALNTTSRSDGYQIYLKRCPINQGRCSQMRISNPIHGNQGYPVLGRVSNSSNRLIVIWSNLDDAIVREVKKSDLYYGIFNISGDLLSIGDASPLSSSEYFRFYPSLTKLDDGNSVLSWTQKASLSSGGIIYVSYLNITKDSISLDTNFLRTLEPDINRDYRIRNSYCSHENSKIIPYNKGFFVAWHATVTLRIDDKSYCFSNLPYYDKSKPCDTKNDNPFTSLRMVLTNNLTKIEVVGCYYDLSSNIPKYMTISNSDRDLQISGNVGIANVKNNQLIVTWLSAQVFYPSEANTNPSYYGETYLRNLVGEDLIFSPPYLLYKATASTSSYIYANSATVIEHKTRKCGENNNFSLVTTHKEFKTFLSYDEIDKNKLLLNGAVKVWTKVFSLDCMDNSNKFKLTKPWIIGISIGGFFLIVIVVISFYYSQKNKLMFLDQKKQDKKLKPVLEEVKKFIIKNKKSKEISVFLCYAWPLTRFNENWTKDFVENLCRHLERAGFNAFIDTKAEEKDISIIAHAENIENDETFVIPIVTRSFQKKCQRYTDRIFKHRLGEEMLSINGRLFIWNRHKKIDNKSHSRILLRYLTGNENTFNGTLSRDIMEDGHVVINRGFHYSSYNKPGAYVVGLMRLIRNILVISEVIKEGSDLEVVFYGLWTNFKDLNLDIQDTKAGDWQNETRLSWYNLRVVSEETKPEMATLYLKEINGKIAYTVITPKGETVNDAPTEIKAPVPFDLNNLALLKDDIFKFASKAGHIHSQDEKLSPSHFLTSYKMVTQDPPDHEEGRDMKYQGQQQFKVTIHIGEDSGIGTGEFRLSTCSQTLRPPPSSKCVTLDPPDHENGRDMKHQGQQRSEDENENKIIFHTIRRDSGIDINEFRRSASSQILMPPPFSRNIENSHPSDTDLSIVPKHIAEL